MLNCFKSVSYRGVHVTLDTIEYAHPYSHLLLTYNTGKGEQERHVLLGFHKGKTVLASKKDLPKEVKELLLRNFLFIHHFVSKRRYLP